MYPALNTSVYFCVVDWGHVPVLHLFIFFSFLFFFWFVFQEKKKRSVEELVEVQELIKTTRERMEEVSSLFIQSVTCEIGLYITCVCTHLSCTRNTKSITVTFYFNQTDCCKFWIIMLCESDSFSTFYVITCRSLTDYRILTVYK